MFLTHKILEQYKPCKKGMEWFDKTYPDGAELMTIMQYPDQIPEEMLYWAHNQFSLTEEEEKRYQEICNITDSQFIVKSKNISHSKYAINSSDVSDSQFVFSSKKVKSSVIVNHSHQVNNSSKVFDSKMVYDSNEVYKSSTVRGSNNIVHSDYIINSQDIIQSTMTNNARYLIGCRNVTNSAFCLEVKDSDHCLFCSKLVHGSYFIFNHQVPKDQWESIYAMFTDMETAPLDMLTFSEPDSLEPACFFSRNSIRQFKPVFTNEVIEWIKSLPYYDEKIVYQLSYIFI